MFVLSALALGICSVVALLPSGSIAQEIDSHANMSCTSTQTPCALGCCPYAEAVCCLDGFECCQKGQTCIPYIGICVGLNDDDEDGVSLVSSKSTPVENLVTTCPPNYTACGVDKCCRFARATCCSDGEHCCPHGFRCDIPHKRCVMDSFNNLISSSSGVTSLPAEKAVMKSPYKSCPGSDKICPSYSSCCITDGGYWGCCPNPSLGRLGVGTGQCCDTIFGYLCCPDVLPTCSTFGCST